MYPWGIAWGDLFWFLHREARARGGSCGRGSIYSNGLCIGLPWASRAREGESVPALRPS